MGKNTQNTLLDGDGVIFFIASHIDGDFIKFHSNGVHSTLQGRIHPPILIYTDSSLAHASIFFLSFDAIIDVQVTPLKRFASLHETRVRKTAYEAELHFASSQFNFFISI